MAKIGETDKVKAIQKLTQLAQEAEGEFIPNTGLEDYINKEKADAWKNGGRSISGFSKLKDDETNAKNLDNKLK